MMDELPIVTRLYDHARNVGGDESFERLYGNEACEAATLIEEMAEALREAEWCLNSAATVPLQDPRYHQEVKALGERIGFGALMSTASRAWREVAEKNGLQGSEFVSGPCRSTAEYALTKVRAALAKVASNG